MDASRHYGQTTQRDSAAMDVVRFAVEVVARLAHKEDDTGVQPCGDFLEGLVTSLSAPDPVTLESLRPHMRASRISSEALADVYIPAAARILGEMWLRDELSFTAVTIGSARLQAILREVSSDWSAEAVRGRTHNQTATVLLVVPGGENHTLGALVLATRLRRLGISVCLSVAPDLSELRQLLRRRQVDGVLISAGTREILDHCRNLVKTIREGAGRAIRIAVGGAVVGSGAADAAALDVDIITSDPEKALQALGLADAIASGVKRA